MASSSLSKSNANGFEQFGQDLYSVVCQQSPNANVFLSPASIALAISMCTVGARNRTLQQMLNTLKASTDQELIQTAEQVMGIFNAASQDKQVQLKLANRLYAQKAYELQKEYLKTVRKSFQADVQLADFVSEANQVVQTINTWVEEQTNKLIKDLLSPSDVTSLTRLILVNCIYFKGTWAKQFEKHSTNNNADFHESNGSVSKIKLMYQKGKYLYTENKNLRVQVAHLPYKSSNSNTQFVFTIILPNQGVQLSDVEQKLQSQPNVLSDLINQRGVRSEELFLYIPKFKMEAQFVLNDALQQLGITDAFNDSADFEGIVSKQVDQLGLKISKVIHKAFIDVNEEGSEAAAATAVVMALKACRVTNQKIPIEFKADRPFLFFIQEIQRNLTLFRGKFASNQ